MICEFPMVSRIPKLNACPSTDLVVSLVGNLLTSPSAVVVATEFHHIRHQIVTFDNDVLNHLKTSVLEYSIRKMEGTHHIDHWVNYFKARNWNIPNILKNSRQDDIPKILKKMLFESRLTIGAAEIGKQLLHGIRKRFVVWVLVELVAKEFDLIENTVRVVLVTIAQERSTTVMQPFPFIGAIV